jgi:cell division protein FtsA
VRVGRPRGRSGQPEAHSGLGLATLAGLVLVPAYQPKHQRQVAQQQAVVRMTPNNLVQRLIAAVKSSY